MNEQRIQIFADCPPGSQDEQAVKDYYDAGFTGWILTEDTAPFTDENGIMTEQYKKNLENVSKYGDVYIRNQYNYPNYWYNEETAEIENYEGVKITIPKRNITTEFNTLGNVIGFYQCDEPSNDKIDELLPLVEWQNTYAKDKLFHVNLFPSYAFSRNGLFGESAQQQHEAYVKKYVDTILAKVESPKTLGLDNYPLIQSNGSNSIRKYYLYDLFVISQTTKDYNARVDRTSDITPGFCIQAFANGDIRDITGRADISFQTNTALAMGAKYFEYFTYNSAGDMPGLIRNGEKSDIYYYVKDVNEELKKWDSVIMSYDWQGAMTVRGSNTGLGDDTYAAFNVVRDRALSSLQMISGVTSTEGTLIGELRNADGTYGYMTVNFTEPSRAKTDVVTYTFPNEVKTVRVYQKGVPKDYGLENQKLTITLEAGDAAFVMPYR